MKTTGEMLIQHMESCCKNSSKLFVPDSPRQEAVAKALADFYEEELLFQAVDMYIKSRSGPFLLFDFAVESKKFVDKVVFERKAINKFTNIVAETKKRMEIE
jgi:hypothetical protein